MRYLWMTLLVLSPAILYGIALIAVGLASRFYRSRCPECRQRGLKMIDFIKATVLINGRRAPDHWADYKCGKCGVVLRWHHQQWEPASDAATGGKDNPPMHRTWPASGPYRFLAACMGAFMLIGAVAFLYFGIQANRWRMLMWVPIFLLNAGGFFGLARTGRWWGWRRSAGR